MSRDIKESDWKIFRKIRETALERLCQRVIDEISNVASDESLKYHDRYLKIYKLIDRRDDQIARAFNDPRRSRGIRQIALIYSLNLLKPEEFERFSPETRESIEFWAKNV